MCRFVQAARNERDYSAGKIISARNLPFSGGYVNVRFLNDEMLPVQLADAQIGRGVGTCLLKKVQSKFKCIAKFAGKKIVRTLLNKMDDLAELGRDIEDNMDKMSGGIESDCTNSILHTFGIAPKVGWPLGFDLSILHCANQAIVVAQALKQSKIGSVACDGSDPDAPTACDATEERDASEEKFDTSASYAAHSAVDEPGSCTEKLDMVAHLRADFSFIAKAAKRVKKMVLKRGRDKASLKKNNAVDLGKNVAQDGIKGTVSPLIDDATTDSKDLVDGNVDPTTWADDFEDESGFDPTTFFDEDGSLGFTAGVSFGPIGQAIGCAVTSALKFGRELKQQRTPICLKECSDTHECEPYDDHVGMSEAAAGQMVEWKRDGKALTCEIKDEINWESASERNLRCT